MLREHARARRSGRSAPRPLEDPGERGTDGLGSCHEALFDIITRCDVDTYRV